MRHHLDTFEELAVSLSERPTHLAEIVEQDPSYAGATDAAKAGMGGVYYDSLGFPHVWRFPFPPEVQKRLVSTGEPCGNHHQQRPGAGWHASPDSHSGSGSRCDARHDSDRE